MDGRQREGVAIIDRALEVTDPAVAWRGEPSGLPTEEEEEAA